MLELYIASNGTYSYGHFKILMSDGKFFITRLSGSFSSIKFYKDDSYFYIRNFGGPWTRYISFFSIGTYSDYKYKDVTNEVDISSLTEILLS